MPEPTFKLICYNTAVQLFDVKHDVYCSHHGGRIFKITYPPSEFTGCNPIFYITTELHNKLMNKRTPQQAFIDSKPAQEAWLAGKPLQFGYPQDPDVWQDLHNSCVPRFADPTYIWRPKPEPEKVPFNQQTIPADAWFRKREGMAMYRPNVITFDGILLNGTMYFYSKLATDFEHTTDRINWQPCYILKTT